jgi:hypothetical protein
MRGVAEGLGNKGFSLYMQYLNAFTCESTWNFETFQLLKIFFSFGLYLKSFNSRVYFISSKAPENISNPFLTETHDGHVG